jgi:predicted regulator of Ras-like GTPase activity (Roadblock/LC7/MglB family)
MSELSAVKSALDRIGAMEHITDVALISRGGMFVMGTTPPETHRETFSAMCAIILGAGQAVTTDMRDRMERVKVMMGERDLIIMGTGSKYLIAMTADRQIDEGELDRETRELADRIDSTL